MIRPRPVRYAPLAACILLLASCDRESEITGPGRVQSVEVPGPQMAVVEDGIISRWSAEGDATDDFGGNHGTISGAVTFVPGVIGLAFRFDGSTGRVSAPSDGIPIGAMHAP